MVAGHASPEEQALLPDAGELASIAAFGVYPDGSVNGVTLCAARVPSGRRRNAGHRHRTQSPGASGAYPPGAAAPDSFTPFSTAGVLELTDGGNGDGRGHCRQLLRRLRLGCRQIPATAKTRLRLDIGLVINEVASKGDPLDWFELHNASDAADQRWRTSLWPTTLRTQASA